MDEAARHQCVIYKGSPAKFLPDIARCISAKLKWGYRCVYLNSPAITASLRSSLTIAGVNVPREVRKGALVLVSDQRHLVNGEFSVNAMIDTLAVAYADALRDGYTGLWASGDMAWEFGHRKDFAKLVEYERALEEFFWTHACISGVCQYHQDILPADVVRQGFETHRSVYMNEALAVLNPFYVSPEPINNDDPAQGIDGLDHMIAWLQKTSNPGLSTGSSNGVEIIAE